MKLIKKMGNFFKNNKKGLIVGLIILVLIVVGYFLVNNESLMDRIRFWGTEAEIREKTLNFAIEKTSAGTFVVNNSEKFKAKVPDGWIQKELNPESFSVYGIAFTSQDIILNKNYLLEKGCLLNIAIEESADQRELVVEYLKNLQGIVGEVNGYEVLDIGGKKGLKEYLIDVPKIGFAAEVRVPLKGNKNLYFSLKSSYEDKEKCGTEFDNFFKSALIK
jgi:hypothetical protein